MTRNELIGCLLRAKSDAERYPLLQQLRALDHNEPLMPKLRKITGVNPEAPVIVTQGDMRVTGHPDGRVTVCPVGSEEDNG